MLHKFWTTRSFFDRHLQNFAMMLFYAMIGLITGASVDYADFSSAVRVLDEEVGWAAAFSVKHYCLVDDSPYTMRIVLEKGESTRIMECHRPWRLHSWYCDETDDTCARFTIQR